MDRIRIVLAEDHAVVRQGTRQLLEQHQDLEVVGEAANGEEAVALVEQFRPDVAIIDIAMPVMNGIETTRQIKTRWPTTAVLILTAYDDDQYVFALLEAGAAGYLLKDVLADELVRAVRAVHAGEPALHPAVTRKLLARVAGVSQAPSQGKAEEPLSEREREVLTLAARGMSNLRIAEELYVSPRTVQAHLTHIFAKLGVGSRIEAVMAALRQGWLRIEDVDSES